MLSSLPLQNIFKLKALENSDHTLEVFMAHAKTSYASEYHFTVNKVTPSTMYYSSLLLILISFL